MRPPLHIVSIHRDRNCLILRCKQGLRFRFVLADAVFAAAALRIANRPLNGVGHRARPRTR